MKIELKPLTAWANTELYMYRAKVVNINSICC